MGNSVSRPSCLGEKSPRSEDLLKDRGLATRNNEEDHSGPLEKVILSSRVIENGWNVVLEGAGKSSPLPKQNNVDVKLQNCPPSKAQLEGAMATCTSPSLGSNWGWKPCSAREVTEVTEITETVVTEIVEVTQHPGGGKSQEALVTRTVKVLADFRGALPEAAAFPGGAQRAGLTQETAGKLLAWVSDAEDLVAHQKPPSAEARVVKAQLQEQKLLLRLLEERMSHVEHLCQGSRPLPAEPVSAIEGQEEPGNLVSLREKWAILVQEAEARHSSLQQILPAANIFQESVDSFQDWLGFMERKVAQLWRAHGSPAQAQATRQQIQDLCKEIQSKPAELEQALEHGQHLLEMVPGEARLVRGKMDSLRVRLLVVGQSSSDILQRLERALETPLRLDPAQEGLALWLQHMEEEQPLPGGGRCLLAPADREELEQRLRSELAAVSRLSLCLEELSQVPLNVQAVHLALAEQKHLSAESLHHQGMVGRLVGIADPLLSFCPADVQKQFQPLVRPLQERAEDLGRQSSACPLQLEQVRLLLTQHTEARAELGPWLEEAQRVAEEFSPSSIGYEAFREQQEVLQGLREAIAEHRPLMVKLQCVTTQLAELCPQEAAPLWQSLQATEEQYISLQEGVQQAAAVLGEAIPRYSQLSERMELMAGCLEWAQDRMQLPPVLRGDPIWLQEQLWENSLRLAELEKLGVALETLRGQGAELLATLQTTAHPAIQELQHQWRALWKQEEEREASLQELLALASRFWPGLAHLAGALRNAQQMVPDLEETAASDPKGIQAKLLALQALREEADALHSELDSLGAWGVELMSLCGDLEKPTTTKSLDDLYSSWNSLNKMWEERQNHLEDQLQASILCQEAMERLLAWLEEAEQRVAEEFLVGADLVQVKQELSELKAEEFHTLVHSFLSRLSELEKSVAEGKEAVAEGQSQFKELWQSVQCQHLELEGISSLGEGILSACHPDAVGTVHSWVALAKSRFQQLCGGAQQQELRLQAHVAPPAADPEEAEWLADWIVAARESLSLQDQQPLPEDAGQLEELRRQHAVFMQELDHKQPEMEKITKSCRRKGPSELGVTPSFRKLSSGWHGASRAFPRPPLEDPEPQSQLLDQLVHRWQCLWRAALDRQHRLQNSQQRLQELEELAHFDFAVWRKRYLQWISHRKFRVLDVFRSIDRDQDGHITQQEFVGSVLASKFPTSLPEMKVVAKIFDTNRDGFIDHNEFISALHPNGDILRRAANVDRIQEEVSQQVAQCNCVEHLQVEQISASRHRFGEAQQLRMVRILRSTLMVRVGGGWTALDEFLVKNDPCRVKGRTNLKINEKYLSPDLVGRKGVGSQSPPTSKALSPSCSTSGLSLYSSASAPNSPVPRKAVLRRTRSGDRCLHSRSAVVTEGTRLTFAAGPALEGASPDAEPPSGGMGLESAP